MLVCFEMRDHFLKLDVVDEIVPQRRFCYKEPRSSDKVGTPLELQGRIEYIVKALENLLGKLSSAAKKGSFEA